MQPSWADTRRCLCRLENFFQTKKSDETKEKEKYLYNQAYTKKRKTKRI